jgi:predicted nucleotidyltransferase component of viral defense system
MHKPKNLFSSLVSKAAESAGAHLRPVIEKEILHYDIMHVLIRERLMNSLTFQGGTLLRLCHGANRYSEDLDFMGGEDFAPGQLLLMKECLEDYLTARYNLPVKLKTPAETQAEIINDGIRVDKWQLSITTSPERRDLPQQRIKLEVANLSAMTREMVSLKINYAGLPDGYGDLIVPSESLNEVLADKLVAFPSCQKYIRHRDIWDIRFLQQKGATVDLAMVERKIIDYKVDNYQEKLAERISALPGIVDGVDFDQQMTRFLPDAVLDRTLRVPAFKGVLTNDVNSMLKTTMQGLFPSVSVDEEPAMRFEM